MKSEYFHARQFFFLLSKPVPRTLSTKIGVRIQSVHARSLSGRDFEAGLAHFLKENPK